MVTCPSPKGTAQGKEAQGVAGDVQGQQLPERQRRFPAKIASTVPLAKEGGGELSAPDNAVELLPGVAHVRAVKVDDEEPAPRRASYSPCGNRRVGRTGAVPKGALGFPPYTG